MLSYFRRRRLAAQIAADLRRPELAGGASPDRLGLLFLPGQPDRAGVPAIAATVPASSATAAAPSSTFPSTPATSGLAIPSCVLLVSSCSSCASPPFP